MTKLLRATKMGREFNEREFSLLSPALEQLSAEASARYAERDIEEGRDLDDWLDAESRLRHGHEYEHEW